MPRSLAKGHTKLAIWAVAPGADNVLTALPVAAFAPVTDIGSTGPTGALDPGPRILAGDFKLGATGDKTVTESALSEVFDADVPTSPQYGGTLTPFRYFDATGKAETGTAGNLGDAAFQAVKVLGTTLFIARRDTSKLSTEDWESGDEYKLFEVITGACQESPQDGYIKHPCGLYVQRAWDGVVAA